LEALERGDFTKLMIFIPPRYGKSLTSTSLFPAWYLGRHPENLVFLSSYSQELVEDFAQQAREYIASDYHQAIFPDCRIDERWNAKHDFRTTVGGACRAAGVGGSITGRGANLYVIDDPIKGRKEAESETVQRELRTWFTNTVLTRRDVPDARILLINTRWAPEDLAGWELAGFGVQWRVLELPALGEWQPDGTRTAKEDGDALWPERFPRDYLEDMRERMPRDEWLALFQQRPTKDGDETVFADEWFQSFSPRPDFADTRLMNGYIIVDPASKKKKKSDRTAMWVVGLAADRNYYFVDGIRDRLGLREKWDALKELHKKWAPNFRRLQVFYEEFGLQADREYFEERMKLEGYRFHVERIGSTSMRKEDLIRGFGTGVCRDRRVFFSPHISCMTDGKRVNLAKEVWEQEWKRYPACKHDDSLNCMAYVTDPRIGQNFPTQGRKGGVEEMLTRWKERHKGITPMGA
jgi:hypothetical protein